MKTLLSLLLCALCGLSHAAPVRIIFDTDMANDCDDAGALAVLHALADKGEAEILAIVTNRKDPSGASAAACAAINAYYGRPDIPIGTDKDGAKTKGRTPSSYAPALRDEFPHHAKPDDQMPDAVAVLRRVLAAAPDKSITYCSVGALSNLEDLLRSQPDDLSPLSGLELIEKKIQLTVIMGGGFPRTANPETNIKLDPAAAITVVNEWPGPILWQGYEVGAAIITGAELQKTPAASPVRRAFELRMHHGAPALAHGKPSYDQATVLLAVRGPQPELWDVIEKGRVIFDSDGHCQWSRDWSKAHRYVKIQGSPKALTNLIGELMSNAPKHHP
jgi:inosine-uridine nucleoside N-ribohydrolase